MDHLQLAVFLSMAGTFLLGLLVKASFVAAWAYGQGRHDARLDTVEELTEVLTDMQWRAGGAL